MRPRSPSRGRNVNNSVTVMLGFGLDTEGADICQGVGKCPTFGGCESSRASRWLSIISWPTPRHATPPKSMRRRVVRARTRRAVLISVSRPGKPLVTHSIIRSPRSRIRGEIASLARSSSRCLRYLLARSVRRPFWCCRHWPDICPLGTSASPRKLPFRISAPGII